MIKPGDRALVVADPATQPGIPPQLFQYIGQVVHVLRLEGRDSFWGPMWIVQADDGWTFAAAEMVLQKWKDDDDDDTANPDQKIPWDKCLWKPAGVTA